MLFIQVFVVALVIKKIASEIERVYRLHHHFAGCHAPELIAATKFKTTKINFGGLFGLSMKINTHENYPLYGMYADIITTNTVKLKVTHVHALIAATLSPSQTLSV